MSEQPPAYAVPTHLEQREPFAFGRTVGEIARLAVVGFVAARLMGADELHPAVRFPIAAVVLVAGAIWALVRVHRRPVDAWLGIAFRYGATPRRRVWRSEGSCLSAELLDAEPRRGWCELNQVRVRWTPTSVPDSQEESRAHGSGARL